MERVFVYGSLKRGHYNHPLLDGCDFSGVFLTQNNYVLMRGAGFPYLLKPQHATLYVPRKVLGECYRVDQDTFQALDALESNGLFYQREKIELKHVHTLQTKTAWAYFLLPQMLHEPTPAASITPFMGEEVYEWLGNLGSD